MDGLKEYVRVLREIIVLDREIFDRQTKIADLRAISCENKLKLMESVDQGDPTKYINIGDGQVIIIKYSQYPIIVELEVM